MNRAIISVVFLLSSLCAQEKGQWVKGKASTFGTDFKTMQIEALKRARADALNQAGIVVSASSFRMQTETNKNLSDYYSQFTEASSRGIILQQRNIKISDPVRLSQRSEKDDIIFQTDAELEAYVVIPEGQVDPGFSVAVQSAKTTVRENDPVQLKITSSMDGYVTLLQVKNDTIQIAFPNGLSRNNKIEAKKSLIFPTDYELYLTVDDGAQTSSEEFIIVVTKEDIPLLTINDAKIRGDELVLAKLTLTDLSQWLFKLPLDQRATAHTILTVVK